MPRAANATQLPAARLQFVVATDVEKPSPALRKFIRSHCMRGKNRGKILPPRQKKTKKVHDASSSSSQSLPGDSPAESIAPTLSRHTPVPPLPRRLGSKVTTIRWPDSVKPKEVEIVLRFSSISKQILFPLETCIFFEKRAESWIAPLQQDPVYLHAMIFTSQYYFDTLLPPNSSPTNQLSLLHFLETVKLLRKRLAHDDDEVRLSYTTATAVMGLAGHAFWAGSLDAAKNHMKGLCRIVCLRGGVATFKQQSKLLIEILRCDLGIAIHSGSKPLFFNKSSSPEPYPPYPNLKVYLDLRGPAATAPQSPSARFFDDMADNLVEVWEIMSEFCSVINFAADSGQFISVETLLETFSSVMYRLLDMDFDSGSSDEAIRLGLLAFSCSVFLQWQYLGMSYPPIMSAFRNCLTTMEFQQLSPDLVLWLFMVGAALVFDATDDWWLKPALLAKVGLCEIRSWSEMQHLLTSTMWIGLIHDKPGRRVYESINDYSDNSSLDVSHSNTTSSTPHLSKLRQE